MAGIATLSPPAASTVTGAPGFVKVRAARGIDLENPSSVGECACKALARRAVALDQWLPGAHAPDQTRERLARMTDHPCEKAQDHALVGAFEAGAAEAPQHAGDEIAAPVGGHRKGDGHGTVEKGPQLAERRQPSVGHVDRHASHHNRSQGTPSDSNPVGKGSAWTGDGKNAILGARTRP